MLWWRSQLVLGGSEFAPRPVWLHRPHSACVGLGLFPVELHTCLSVSAVGGGGRVGLLGVAEWGVLQAQLLPDCVLGGKSLHSELQ